MVMVPLSFIFFSYLLQRAFQFLRTDSHSGSAH
jgi:hypothetical protein